MKLWLETGDLQGSGRTLARTIEETPGEPALVDVAGAKVPVIFADRGVILISPTGDLEVPDDGRWHLGEVGGVLIRARIAQT